MKNSPCRRIAVCKIRERSNDRRRRHRHDVRVHSEQIRTRPQNATPGVPLTPGDAHRLAHGGVESAQRNERVRKVRGVRQGPYRLAAVMHRHRFSPSMRQARWLPSITVLGNRVLWLGRTIEQCAVLSRIEQRALAGNLAPGVIPERIAQWRVFGDRQCRIGF